MTMATTLLHKPQLKDCYHVEVVNAENVFLLTENASWLLGGRAYPHLVPLLTGEHSTDELARQLSGIISAAEVYYAVHQLASRGYVVEGDIALPSEQRAFWHALGVDARTVSKQLRATRVRVNAHDAVAYTALVAALTSLGVQVADVMQTDDVPTDLDIVLVNDYMHPDIADINRAHLASGKAWVLAKLEGNLQWFGPIFRRGQTACWECLANRLSANRQLESYIMRRNKRAEPLPTSLATLPSTLHMGVNWLATEIAKGIVLGHSETLDGQIVTFNTATLVKNTHVLTRRPQCGVCGDAESFRRQKPITLTSSKKRFSSDGGHRSISPEDTFARFSKHISPITGVVNWLVDITEDSQGHGTAYSYVAGHNFAMVQDNLFWLQNNLRSRTGGKGMTDIQAKVSAIGESVERYSGVYRGEECVVRGTYRDLAPQAIHLRDVLGISEQQYATRHEWNRSQGRDRFHIVPNPLDESMVIDWSPVWSLTHNQFRYLPTSLCYYGHPDATKHFFCMSDSNGASAGNTLEEAILQGFLELVERDSVAMWWYNRARRPGVNLASFNLGYLDTLQTFYGDIDRDLWVLDLTSDLGVPVYAAVSRRRHAVEDVIIGFGAHFDPKVAMLRAVTELNQFLPAVYKRDAEGNTRYNFPEGLAYEWWRSATIASEPYLVPAEHLSTRTLADATPWVSDDLKTDVEHCVDVAARAGMEVLVLDQTRPDIGMSVCHVFVPGLRHFWRRLGPGRLYDVPVQLGWLDRANTEAELNPRSLFF